MKTTYMVAALALMTATGALAKDKDQVADGAKAEKKVCRSEGVTGSLARVNQICMTKEEWNALSRQTKSDIDDLQHHGAVQAPDKGPFG